MNALEEYIKFEKNNISLFAKEVLSDYYVEELFSHLLDTYFENRYYNFYSEENTTLEENIFEHLKKTLTKLLEGSDEETKNKLTEMYVIFNYILCYDEVNIINDRTLVKLLCDYRSSLFGSSDNLFKEKISKLINTTREKRKAFFDYFHTNDFYIKKYTTSKENVIDIVIDHKLQFPKLYSEYAIDRVFNEDTIKEDKLLVEYYLMTDLIVKDVRECIFDKYYLIEFAPSLFEDKERLQKLLDLTLDDCFKNQTVMKIDYEDYVKYNNNIKDMIRDGYKFAIFVDDNDVKEEDFILFEIFDYIVVDSKSKYCKYMDTNDKILVINDR